MQCLPSDTLVARGPVAKMGYNPFDIRCNLHVSLWYSLNCVRRLAKRISALTSLLWKVWWVLKTMCLSAVRCSVRANRQKLSINKSIPSIHLTNAAMAEACDDGDGWQATKGGLNVVIIHANTNKEPSNFNIHAIDGLVGKFIRKFCDWEWHCIFDLR